jgi:hypothetical protein
MGRDITRPGTPVTQVPVKGSAVRMDPFEHLFQHIKQADPMLYEALKRMSRFTTEIQEKVENNTLIEPKFDKATFGLLRPLVILPALTNYYICRKAGEFIDVALKNKVAPDGTDGPSTTILDICLSVDDGTTFTSIFNSSEKISIVHQSTKTIVIPKSKFGLPGIKVGNLLRIDCLQCAKPNPGSDFEVVLRWE